MKRDSAVARKDELDDQAFADRTQREQVLRGDQLLRAARLLEQEEFAILKLHDVEGRSMDELHVLTGLPHDVIEAQIDELRRRFTHHIQVAARRWRERLAVLEGDQK
jgi:hypothetical protein